MIVLIGIVLVVIIGLVIMIKQTNIIDKLTLKQTVISSQVIPIRNSVQNCIELISKDAIKLIGIQGGRISTIRAYDTGVSLVSYGYYNNQNTLPSLREITGEINLYIKTFLPYCLKDDYFPEFNIDRKEVISKNFIREGVIEIEIRYPLVAEKDGITYQLNVAYNYNLQVNLLDIHKTATEIIEKIEENSDYIELSYLTNLNYDVTILPTEENIFIYSITDKIGLEGNPYTFMFAVNPK